MPMTTTTSSEESWQISTAKPWKQAPCRADSTGLPQVHCLPVLRLELHAGRADAVVQGAAPAKSVVSPCGVAQNP